MRLAIWTDGGSRGNPGPAAGAFVIKQADPPGSVLFAAGYFLGKATNNQAEYQAVLRSLQQALKLGGTKIQIYSDSELVVRQLNGQYRVKNANIRPIYDEVIEWVDQFESVTFTHVFREKNVHADALVNQALDAKKNVIRKFPASKPSADKEA